MSYMVIYPSGKSDIEYPLDKLHLLIDQLEGFNSLESCVSLTHKSEWCLSIHTNGYLLWENTMGELQDTWHMKNVSTKKLLTLWRLLANGEINKIHTEDWDKGDPIYGI